jgi:hypothetical protein
MTDGELSRLKALAEAATPGPWDVYSETIADKSAATAEFDYQVQNTEPFVGRVFMLNGDGKCPAITGCGPTSEANAAFIAASRKAVPALVAEVRRLREALTNIKNLPGELNLSNYNSDDVDALNNAHIEAFQIARAALEGK